MHLHLVLINGSSPNVSGHLLSTSSRMFATVLSYSHNSSRYCSRVNCSGIRVKSTSGEDKRTIILLHLPPILLFDIDYCLAVLE